MRQLVPSISSILYIAVCTGESADDCAFIFKALKGWSPEWSPSILLADGSNASTAGFTEMFEPPVTRLMYYFHILHNTEKYLKVLTKNGVCGQTKVDLNALQSSKDEAIFKKGAQLFLSKWKVRKDPQIHDSLQYFKTQSLDKYDG